MSDFALALGLAIPKRLPTTHFVEHKGLWVPPDAVKSEYGRFLPMPRYPWLSRWLSTQVDDELEPPEPLPQETVTECIIGWRRWDYTFVSSKLRLLESTSQYTLWPPGEALYAPKPPALSNAYGIYAYKTRKHATEHMDGPPLYGSVALGGKIIECENGYRAEYAYPQHLYLRYSYFSDEKGADDARRAYASTYGCEVERAPADEDPDDNDDDD